MHHPRPQVRIPLTPRPNFGLLLNELAPSPNIPADSDSPGGGPGFLLASLIPTQEAAAASAPKSRLTHQLALPAIPRLEEALCHFPCTTCSGVVNALWRALESGRQEMARGQ